MKVCIIILVSLIFCCGNIFSQNEKYYYFYTDTQIKENTELNRHTSCQVLCLEDSIFYLGTVSDFGHYGITPTVINCISIGEFKIINDILFCYDKKLYRTYKFKQIDFYTLEAMNHTAVFVKGTKIHLHIQSSTVQSYYSFFHPNSLINSDYWKTGVKNGIHKRYDNDTKILYYYQNDNLTDSISFYYSMYHSDSASIVKEVFFIEQYGNTHDFSKYHNNDLNLILCDYNYLLMTGKNIISVGKLEKEYRDSSERFFADYRDINGKYEFTLSKKDDFLVVISFTSDFSDSEIFLSVGDTLWR